MFHSLNSLLTFDFDVQFVTQTGQAPSADVRVGTFGRTTTAGPMGPVTGCLRGTPVPASLVFQLTGNTANPKQVTVYSSWDVCSFYFSFK